MASIRYTSFEHIAERGTELVRYMEENGITIRPNSCLMGYVEKTREVCELYEQQSVPESYDAHAALDALANLGSVAAAVLRARGTPLESRILGRLRELAKGQPGQLTAGKRSRHRDLSFELLCIDACSLFAAHPDFGEPDVICEYRDVSWGLACKCAYGSPATVAKRCRAGMSQIQKSDVDLGMVIVQVTNLFPHTRMYHRNPDGTICSFHSMEDRGALLNKLMWETVEPIEAKVGASLRVNTKDTCKARAIFYVAHTVAYFRERRCVMVGNIYQRLGRVLGGPEEQFVRAFNDALQVAYPR